jgi:signal transduction histidine kinase
VSVTVESRDCGIHCLVEDDGVGFDSKRIADTVPRKNGMGLQLMTERVRMLGGTLDIKSEPAKGTCITFSFPLPDTRSR